MSNMPEYISTETIGGVTYLVDRRQVETRADGSRFIRDPVTGKMWTTGGDPLPRLGRRYEGIFEQQEGWIK